MSMMKSMLSQGDIESAQTIARDLIERVGATLKKNEELIDLVGTAQTKISEAKSKGWDVSDAEILFKDLSSLWGQGYYEDARDKAKKCIEILLRKELSNV